MNQEEPKFGEPKVVYEGNNFEVVEIIATWPDGKESTLEFITRWPGVAVLALNENDQLLLIKERRFTIDSTYYTWQLPAGGIEPGDDELDTAKRELQEEAGFKAGDWEFMGTRMIVDYADYETHNFIARDLERTEDDPEHDESIIEMKFFDLQKAKQMVLNDEIKNLDTGLAVIKLAEQYE